MDESRAVPRFSRATYTSANRLNIRPMIPHTTTSRTGTLGRLCNISMLHYLKKYFGPFAFTEIILRLLKVPYFWYVSSLHSHCHGSLKVSEMDQR